MDEVAEIVRFIVKGFVYFLAAAAALALVAISGHVLYYACRFSLMDIGIDRLLIEVIVMLFSVGILYVFVPVIRR